jgi:hypothetical protein
VPEQFREVVITLISPQTRPVVKENVSKAASLHWLIALLTILLLEIVCFGPITRNVGFYLDDWATVCELHSLTGDFFARFIHFLLWDPRVTPRPVEALFYVATFDLFGLKPLGWHIVNQCLEVFGSFFFYMALAQLTRRRTFALLSAAIFLLYPSHDATHYWATCDSETLSTCFAMASLWLTTAGVARNKKWYALLSVLCFNIAIFCYETLLPLVSLNVIFAAIEGARRHKTNKWRWAIKTGLICVVPFVLSVVALLVYSRGIVPHIGHPQVHQVVLSPQVMGTALGEGIKLNMPWICAPFFAQQVNQYLARSGVAACLIAFVLNGALIVAGLGFLSRSEDDAKARVPLYVVLVGACTIVASYTIFGLNPEYVPTLLTIVNRVNAGASVGMSIILAAIPFLFLERVCKLQPGRGKTALLCLFSVPLVAFFCLTNRGLAIPWTLSWELQRNIFQSLKRQSAGIKDGDSIILANCPRYVNWAPLFDGVWDFQAMLRLAVNNNTVNGGVVSDRLIFSGKQLKDMSRGVLCGLYDIDKLSVVVAPSCELIRIQSAQQFIQLIEERGFGFDLNRAVLKEWRNQLKTGGDGKEQPEGH